MLPDIIIFYGWIASIAFAVLSLIVKGIRAIVRKVRKSKKKIVLGKMTGFISLTELIMDLFGLTFMMLMTSWMHHSTYSWLFPVFGIMAVVIAALTVASLIVFIKTPAKESSVIRKIYNIVAMLFAVINVAFIIHMQLWH